MADSDEEYVGEISEDEDNGAHLVTRGPSIGTRSRRKKAREGAGFEIARTWETLVEDADGTISSTVVDLLEAGKRKR
jgi:transcription initiation factor TFIIH subunit 2